jgi:hypothetical protein
LTQGKVFDDLYHMAAPKKKERSRRREVTLDSLGSQGEVRNTPQGIEDQYGNIIHARIDTQGRLMDVLEPRFYYEL